MIEEATDPKNNLPFGCGLLALVVCCVILPDQPGTVIGVWIGTTVIVAILQRIFNRSS